MGPRVEASVLSVVACVAAFALVALIALFGHPAASPDRTSVANVSVGLKAVPR